MLYNFVTAVLKDCKDRLAVGFKGARYVYKGRSKGKDKEYLEDDISYRIRKIQWEEHLKNFIRYIESNL